MAYPSRYGAANRRQTAQFYLVVLATFLLAVLVGGLFVVLASTQGATPFGG
jgi:hypothetical protein